FDYYYSPVNSDKVDSAYYYYPAYTPAQYERLYFTSNASDEIIEIKFYVHDNGEYEYEYRFVFGEEVLFLSHSSCHLKELILFPIPATERIFIREAEAGSYWYLYNSQGLLQGEGVYDSDKGVYVNDIGKGFYTLVL